MNKTINIAYLIIFICLISCTSILEQQKKGTTDIYKDGIYTEEGDRWKYGNENATVTIHNGKITEITLRKLDNIGSEVDYGEWTGERINGIKRPNLNKYRIDVAQKMLKKQTYDVDAVSGATISSENWKRAVSRALDKASR